MMKFGIEFKLGRQSGVMGSVTSAALRDRHWHGMAIMLAFRQPGLSFSSAYSDSSIIRSSSCSEDTPAKFFSTSSLT